MQSCKRVRYRAPSNFSLWRTVEWTLNIVFLLCILVGITACVLVYNRFMPLVKSYAESADKIVKNSCLEDFRTEQTSYIYASNNKVIAKLKTDKDVNYVKFDNLPTNLVNAVIAIEDKRFYEHSGVDWMSTAKAAVLYLKNPNDITRGGSTITQQLVKNIYLSYEKSLERKGKEIFIALGLEHKYSKEQILEFYLNNVNYANGYYGIGAAAKGYFNKSVEKLSLTEIAFLCAIPNNPTLYNPRTNLRNTLYRRNVILKEMCSQGFINRVQYFRASNAVVRLHKNKQPSYNYETSYAIECAVHWLMKRRSFSFRYKFRSDRDFSVYRKRYAEEYEEARQLLYTNGYRIYTSIDLDVQRVAQKVIDKRLSSFHSKKQGVYEVQGAVTVMNNKTGKVIAIVGGRSQKWNGMITLNRAFQSYRQPGSTIKPLAVYAPSFEHGFSPNSIVDDSYSNKGPKNSGNTYSGLIPLRSAVEQSKNVVAWNVFNAIGPKTGLAYLQEMKFTRIVPRDYNLSSALGGLTNGVTTVEMASGYRTLANDGNFSTPTCITRVETSSGMSIELDNYTNQVYEKNTAREMTDVLQGVAKRGTAEGLALKNGMPIACKTGTTNEQRNAWFCGYTPYYTVACYVGADQNQSIDGLWGATYPLEIWKGIQEYLNRDKKVVKFKKKIIEPVEKDLENDDSDEEAQEDSDIGYTQATQNPGTLVESTIKPTAPVVTEQPSVTKKAVRTKPPVSKNTATPKSTKKPVPKSEVTPKPEVTPEPQVTDEPPESDDSSEINDDEIIAE